VENGVVVLPPESKLADGTNVEVIVSEVPPVDPPFFQAILKLSKSRPEWPEDFELNQAHYAKGNPKKA
jgi:hypothetical protein